MLKTGFMGSTGEVSMGGWEAGWLVVSGGLRVLSVCPEGAQWLEARRWLPLLGPVPRTGRHWS